MPKGRLTAVSDGVVSIIITIMVLELKVPHAAEWSALASLAPVFASYILSFIYIGIYWNNQPPSAAHLHEGERRDIVGEPTFAVLALARAFCHRLAWGESLCAAANRPLWPRAADAGHRLLPAAEGDHRPTRR